MIRLGPLPRARVSEVAHLELPAAQEPFVGTIAEMTAEADRLQDFHLARAGDDAVGFFKIDRDFARRDPRLPQRALGMRGLLIGGQYQGRGYGTALLAALPGYLRRQYPMADAVWLTVDAGNEAALRAYCRAGWEVSDLAPFPGRWGPEPVLRLPLDPSP